MFWWNKTDAGQVPIIVDLKDVKISEMTNLPPKAKFGKEDKEASQVKRKIEKKYTKEETDALIASVQITIDEDELNAMLEEVLA